MYPNNMQRDLLGKLQSPELALVNFSMPITNQAGRADQTILLPHVLFSQLYHNYKEAWIQRVAPPERLAQFWSEVPLGDHPIRENLKYVIPICIEGDAVVGVGKSWSKSADIWCWRSLVGEGPSSLTHFVMWVCFGHCQTKGFNSTLLRLWRILAWSLTWLYRGQWPDRDVLGRAWPRGSLEHDKALKPLADGFSGVVWGLQADLEWYNKSFGLEHWGSNTPCFACQANKSTRPFTDFTPTSQWRQTVWTSASWKQHHRAAGRPVFSIPGVSITSCIPDWMHSKHLGLDQYLLGSTLWLLCFQLGGDVEPAGVLARVFHEVKCYYKAYRVKHQFSTLKLSMFVQKGKEQTSFPCLKGKAAEVRWLVYALHDVWRQWPKPDEIFWSQCELALKRSMELEDLLVNNFQHFKLPAQEQATMQRLIGEFLALYNALAHQSTERGWLLFNLVPKAHYLCHCADLTLNPRVCWNYALEDLMQRMKTLIQSSVRGCKAWQVHNKVMSKYSFALGLHLGHNNVWKL